MKSTNVGLLTVLGVILAATGVVTPIIWDRYKTTSAIELHHIANFKLVERADLPEKLQLTYDGRRIPTLSRHTFSLVNAGRTAILKNDLIVSPTITFQGDVEILEVIEDARTPQNLNVSLEIRTDEKSVVISFPLLNPGDQVQFGILLAGFTSNYAATARIVGIRDLKIIDRVEEFREVKSRIPFTVYFVEFVSGVLIFTVFVGGIPEYMEDIKIQTAISRNEFNIPKGSSKEDYLNFFRLTFSNKSKKELQPLMNSVDMLPSGAELGEADHEKIRQAVIDYAKNQNVLPLMLVFVGLSILGWSYVLWRVL